MIITKIEPQRKDENRSSIFIDGDFAFGASNVDVLFYKLKENMELSEEKYNQILEDLVYVKARDAGFKILGFKSRTEKELYDKLIEKEYSHEVATKIVEEMKKYKYVDDETYAQNFLKENIEYKGVGVNKIKFLLSQKGVSRQIIDGLFEEDNFEEEQLEKVIALIEQKTRRIDIKNITDKEKKKIYDFLLRRGYSYGIINTAFKDVFSMYIDD